VRVGLATGPPLNSKVRLFSGCSGFQEYRFPYHSCGLFGARTRRPRRRHLEGLARESALTAQREDSHPQVRAANRLSLWIQLGTVPIEANDGMLRELVLAIGLPVVLLVLAVLALEHWGDRMPRWLQRLSQRPSLLWNTGIGLIIGLSLLRWLLQR